jgi:hypothetical protein
MFRAALTAFSNFLRASKVKGAVQKERAAPYKFPKALKNSSSKNVKSREDGKAAIRAYGLKSEGLWIAENEGAKFWMGC